MMLLLMRVWRIMKVRVSGRDKGGKQDNCRVHSLHRVLKPRKWKRGRSGWRVGLRGVMLCQTGALLIMMAMVVPMNKEEKEKEKEKQMMRKVAS